MFINPYATGAASGAYEQGVQVDSRLAAIANAGLKVIELKDTLLTRSLPVLSGSVEVARPAQLTAGIPSAFKVYKNWYGYCTDYDVAVNAPTGTTYYVDPVNGLDTNAGTSWAAAVKTISVAVAKSDAVVVMLRDGTYKRNQIDTSTAGVLVQKSLTIKGETPFGAKLVDADDLTWAKTDGYTNVYNATRSSAGVVVDLTNKDRDDLPKKLTLVASIAAVDTTANSYYKDGNVYYVHTFNDRAPDANVSVLFLMSGIISFYPTVNGSKLYLENLLTVGGKAVESSVYYVSGTKDNVLICAKNCKFTHTNTGAAGALQVQGTNSIMQNCLAAYVGDVDGFNYHSNSGQVGWFVEINCTAHDNGLLSGSSNQGSTCHDGYQGIRLNCAYWGNGSQGIADITDGTVTWNVGCASAGNVGAADIQALSGALMILEGCIIPIASRVVATGTIINNNPRTPVITLTQAPYSFLYI